MLEVYEKTVKIAVSLVLLIWLPLACQQMGLANERLSKIAYNPECQRP